MSKTLESVAKSLRNCGILLLILAGLHAAAADTDAAAKEVAPRPSAEFEGGKAYRAGGISILELKGSYRQMGRQYGDLVKFQLSTLYKSAIEDYFIRGRGLSRKRLDLIASSVFDSYPRRYKEILYGMAETSSLDIEKIKLLNAIEWFPKINHLFFGKCSGLAAWGPYTSGGPLVFGRNNDDDPFYKEFAKYMVVAVFKADDGSLPVAIINYAGVIYNATGMNSEGLFTELNSGPWMGFSLNRVSVFVTLFSFLQDYSSMWELDKAFNAMLPNLSTIINVADADGAVSYESSLYQTRLRKPDHDGFLASTNHFVDPSFNLADLDDAMSCWTLERRENLLERGEEFKGRFNPQVMMKILDTSTDNGGATHKGTIYQVVAVPAEKKIWLKIPGFQDWTEIALDNIFKGK